MTDTLRITAAHITNYKRIKDVELRPDADRHLVLIGGKNGQGKSSILDALSAAFGGKKAEAEDPIRHGAEQAEIRIELNGGELTVRRVITASGSVLEVRDQLGAVKSPQSVLDRLVGARFLDPLSFIALPPKEQRAQLMRLIPDAARIGDLNAKRERRFEKRREIGAVLRKAQGELARLPVVEPGTPIDVAELTLAKSTIAAEERERDRLASVLTQAETRATFERADLEATQQQIAKLERELADLRAQLPGKLGAVAGRDEAVIVAKDQLAAQDKRLADLSPRREQVDADLARADAHNRDVYAKRAQMERRAETAATVEQLQQEYEHDTKVLEAIDQRKAEILAAAKLPVEGLGLADDGITLNGVPFSQASGAEKLRVALGLAMAASPALDDVWVRDASLLDDESLELVAQQALAAGKRPWLEIVGTRQTQTGVMFVLADGEVAS